MAAPVREQEALSLADAVRLALAHNQAIEAATAGAGAAEARIAEARSGRLPKLNYAESFTRGDNPVYVFSSLRSGSGCISKSGLRVHFGLGAPRAADRQPGVPANRVVTVTEGQAPVRP